MFKRNITATGRKLRGSMAVVFFAAAGYTGFHYAWWVAALLALGGIFTAFEALRGWCALRACGVKTKF